MTYRGDTRERLDPDHFLALRDADFQAIRSSIFPIKKLKDLSTLVTKGETPLWRGDSFLNEGIPFLRGKNIKGAIDFDDIVYISDDVHERMKRSVLNEDFFLLTIAGTLGDVAFFKKEYPECNINQDIAKIKLTDEISYEYAVMYFQTRFANRQISILSNGATRGHLNFSQVRSFDVIVPPLDIQNRIVGIMQFAYAKKKQKEHEADALLDSIDDYVLSELGIEMPVVEEKKCFAVYVNETVGKRVDPYFHQPKYREFAQSLTMGKYQIATLSSLITDLKNGVEIRTYSDRGYRYLRVSDLGQHGVENHDPRYVDVAEIPDKIRLTSNSFLISRSGSLGLVSVVKDEIREAILSSHIFKVSLNTNQILPKYLEALLRSQIGQTQFFQNNNGGVIPEISQSALKSISVVVPPFDIQEKIADEAIRRQSEAAKLRQEAAEVWEVAKTQFEEQLLSGEVS